MTCARQLFGREIDFAIRCLHHIFNLIGITDARIIQAGQLMKITEPVISRVPDEINAANAMATLEELL
jgi:hypothetical protein